MPIPATVLFTRRVKAFNGGHLKVFDYMGHVAASRHATPLLYLTPDSDAALAATMIPPGVQRVGAPVPAGCHFVAGMDWRLLDDAGIDLAARPVINLVQSVRHASPQDPRHSFLSRPALRLCVSAQIGDALRASGAVNGLIEVIPNALDLTALAAHRRAAPASHVFIAGLKNPALARMIAAALTATGVPADMSLQRIPRADFLDRMADSTLCILLPVPDEGFFLPALEAMALGVPAVVPDCAGTRGFCRHEDTCLVPDATPESVARQALRLWHDPALRERLAANGTAMAARHGLEEERTRFLDLLRRVLA